MHTQPAFSSESLVLRTSGTPLFEAGERVVFMRETALFSGFSFSECLKMAQLGRLQSFARGSMLFMQGEPFRRYILIHSGCVKLTHVSENGCEVILALRGRKDMVDLPPGASPCSHTFTAQAMDGCKALVWNTTSVDELIARTPRLNENMCRILTAQLVELQERYYELSAEKVERRLACVLIRLAAQIGLSSIEGIEVSTSRQVLAQLAGTSLFTVSRIVSRWGELGLIVPRREAVLVLDLKRLNLVSLEG